MSGDREAFVGGVHDAGVVVWKREMLGGSLVVAWHSVDAAAANETSTRNRSPVFECRAMFSGVVSFNDDISKWDALCEVEHTMFWGAAAFNGDISKWDVSFFGVLRRLTMTSRSRTSHVLGCCGA